MNSKGGYERGQWLLGPYPKVSDLETCAVDIHVNCSDLSFAIFACNLIRSY